MMTLVMVVMVAIIAASSPSPSQMCCENDHAPSASLEKQAERSRAIAARSIKSTTWTHAVCDENNPN